MFYANISFPDYTNPCFSDAKLTTKKEMVKNYKSWSKLFPKNQAIKYFATEGKEGALPDYMSKGFLKSGFFVFRNSWGMDATQMVVKAGPKAFGTVSRIMVHLNFGSTARICSRIQVRMYTPVKAK